MNWQSSVELGMLWQKCKYTSFAINFRIIVVGNKKGPDLLLDYASISRMNLPWCFVYDCDSSKKIIILINSINEYQNNLHFGDTQSNPKIIEASENPSINLIQFFGSGPKGCLNSAKQ